MKNSLFLVGALVVGAVSAHISTAAPAPGPKKPGPSAVQAARLKKYPPGGYLSHYLPDDRYKIAGGVWKYVSTDLDTYYHIPSSPNMMRQPSNRVLGFANARDAEEAGYVADPTDGTANRAASTAFGNGNYGNSREDNKRYLNELMELVRDYSQSNANALIENISLGQQLRQQGKSADAIMKASRPFARRFATTAREGVVRFSRIKAPEGMRPLHELYRTYFKSQADTAVYYQRVVNNGKNVDFAAFKSSLDRTEAAGDRAINMFKIMRGR